MSSTLSRYIKSKSINAEIDAVNVIIYSELPPIGSVVTGAEYILKDRNYQIVKSNGKEWINVGGDSMEIGDIIQSAATEHNGFSLIPITNTAIVDGIQCPDLAKLFNYRKAVPNKPNIQLGDQNFDWNNCTSLVYINNYSYCTNNAGTIYKTQDGKNWEIHTTTFPGRIKRGGAGGEQLPWMIPIMVQGTGTTYITWNEKQLYISADEGVTWTASGTPASSNLNDISISDLNSPVDGATNSTGTPWILQSTGNSFEYNIIQITSPTTNTKTTVTTPNTHSIYCIGSSQQIPPSWITPEDTQDDFLFLGGSETINDITKPIIYIKNLRTGTWTTKHLPDSISTNIFSIHYASSQWSVVVFVGDKDITIFKRLQSYYDEATSNYAIDTLGSWTTIPSPKPGTIICSDAVFALMDNSKMSIIVSVNGESYITDPYNGITKDWWDNMESNNKPNTKWIKLPGDYIGNNDKLSYSVTNLGYTALLMHIRNDLYDNSPTWTGTQTYEGVLNNVFSIPGTGSPYDKIASRKL